MHRLNNTGLQPLAWTTAPHRLCSGFQTFLGGLVSLLDLRQVDPYVPDTSLGKKIQYVPEKLTVIRLFYMFLDVRLLRSIRVSMQLTYSKHRSPHEARAFLIFASK